MRIDRHEVDDVGAEGPDLVQATDDPGQVAGRTVGTNVYLVYVHIAGIGYARKRGAILGRILGVQRLTEQHQECRQPAEPCPEGCIKQGETYFHKAWGLVL